MQIVTIWYVVVHADQSRKHCVWIVEQVFNWSKVVFSAWPWSGGDWMVSLRLLNEFHHLTLSSLCLQITKTMTLTCLTPKWTRTSGARRPERRSDLPWKSSLTYWRSIMGINSSFQTGTWSPQEVSSLSRGDVKLCRMLCRLMLLVSLLSVVTCLVCIRFCVVA